MIAGERKVRRGLEGMGVPSSSSGVGGGEASQGSGQAECSEGDFSCRPDPSLTSAGATLVSSKGMGGLWGVQGVVMLGEAEVADRVLKKGCCCGCDALAVEGER